MMKRLDNEELMAFIETQLDIWPMARKNYDDLRHVLRRKMKVGSLEIGLQCNPARMVSTGASLDKESISKRKCFLCNANRPPEQMKMALTEGWELCVNPFPIFPMHFTVIATKHEPQLHVPDAIVEVAEKLPYGMCVFFNGAEAGASAPDHMHMQAVLKDELPLLRLSERIHPSSDSVQLRWSDELDPNLPFIFLSGIVKTEKDVEILNAGLSAGGPDKNGNFTDPKKINSFFWIDSEGYLRFIVIPRRAHRPECYHIDGHNKRIISPGAVDMAGIFILPRESDFHSLAEREAETIFSQCGIK